jgi:hypothetical protein
MMLMSNDIVTLRVARKTAEALDEKAKKIKDYKHSRAPWADLARDILEEVAEVEGS